MNEYEFKLKAKEIFNNLFKWCLEAKEIAFRNYESTVGRITDSHGDNAPDGLLAAQDLEHIIDFKRLLLAARYLVFISRNDRTEKIRMNIWIDLMERSYNAALVEHYREYGAMEPWVEYK